MTTAVPARDARGVPRAKVWRATATGIARVAELATTPLLPQDFLDLFFPLRSGADLRGRVVAVHPETRDSVTLEIKPGRGWAGHRPGQYIRVGIDVDGVRQWRPYSLTSTVGSRTISVTVKAIPDGVVSNYLVRRARPGMLIQLDQATGDFTESGGNEPLLFVTGGSGITPIMGMLRNGIAARRDVVLVHSAPSRDEVVFGGELRRLAAIERIRLIELHTDTDGMLDAARLSELVPDIDSRLTYACGPAGMLGMVTELFAARSLEDRLHIEQFRPAIVVAGEGGTVAYGDGGPLVDVAPGSTLLDAGESAGVLMKSGCRMGICYGCVVPLKEGAVRDLRDGAITTAVEGDGVLIQPCVTTAAGSCHLEL